MLASLLCSATHKKTWRENWQLLIIALLQLALGKVAKGQAYFLLFVLGTSSYVCNGHLQLRRKKTLLVPVHIVEKLTSKVDGFTFVHFYLKVTTSDVKVGY